MVGGITYIYLRQSATDAAQQAQQSQQMMQQMSQDVKKTPEMALAMQQEVVRLNEQLQAADSRNAERMRALSREVAQQADTTRRGQVEAARQAVRELAAGEQPALPPNGGTPASIPSSTPATAPAPAGTVNRFDYDATVRQGVNMLQNGNAVGALRVAEQLMQAQPNRWEAYSIAGSVAKVQNKPSQARSMFEKALSLAPAEVKPSLQQALQEIARGGQ